MTGEEDRSVGRNLCLVMVREGGTLEKIAVAAAFHDLGIWTHKTFDYIPPSVALAHEYLTAHGRADWISYGHASIPGRVRPSDRWLVRCRRWLHVPLSAWCWREPGRHGDPSYPTVSTTVPHPVLPTQTATDVEESDRESWWCSGSLNIQAMVKLTPVASRFVGRVFGGPIYFSALQEPAVSGFQVSESLDLSGGAYAVDG